MIFHSRKTVVLALSGLFLAACSDQDAANRRQAREQFAQAAAQLEQAYRAFPTAPGEDVETYRAAQLTAAARQLAASADQGSRAQQSTSRRLLASAYQALARQAARQAGGAWSDLAAQNSALLQELNIVREADARAGSFDVDVSAPVATLQQRIQENVELVKTLAGQEQELQARIEALAGQKKQLAVARDNAFRRAQDLRDKAFIAPNKEQYDLYQRSLKTERAGQVASADFDRLTVQSDTLAAELAAMRQQVVLAQAAMQTLAARVDMLQQSQEQAKTQRAKALTDAQNPASKKRSGEMLVRQFEQFTQAYAKNVAALFEEAQKQADEAIVSARKVQSLATESRERRLAQFDLLVAQRTKADILTSQIVVQSAYGRCVEVLAHGATQLLPEQAQSFADSLKQIHQNQEQLVTAANELITQANELASQLAAGSANDDISAITADYAQYLSSYSQRVKDAQLAAK